MPLSVFDRSLVAGIQEDLSATWKREMPNFERVLAPLVKKLPYTSIRNATYVWKDSLPFPSLWEYGKSRVYKMLQDRQLKLSKVNYELTIPWSKFDEEDDQLGDMKSHILLGVKGYGRLPMKLVSEYFNSVAVLNPSLNLCYDGVNLFSDVDGDGNARFGVSGGNILTGTGATVAGVLHDMARAQQRYLSMVDPTAGLPIFDEEAVSYEKMIAIIPNSLNEVFQKATKAENIRISNDNNTSETNYLKGTFQYRINPYLTDTSDWYVVVDDPFWKPFIYVAPKSIESIIADVSNSDIARERNENIFYSYIRNSLTPYFPATTIKINN